MNKIFEDEIILTLASKYVRYDGGNDFLECGDGAKLNYITYMHQGSKESFSISPCYSFHESYERRGAFSKDKLLSDSDRKEEMKNVFLNKDNFLLSGVIEFRGEIGYLLFQDYLDSQKFMNKFKFILQDELNLSSSLRFVAALHQNTQDRHIHFLFYSEDEKRNIYPAEANYLRIKTNIVNRCQRFLNSDEYQSYIQKKYDTSSFDENTKEKIEKARRVFDFEIESLDIARNLLLSHENDTFAYFDELKNFEVSRIKECSKKLILASLEDKKKFDDINGKINKFLSKAFLDEKYVDDINSFYEYLEDEFLSHAFLETFSIIKDTFDEYRDNKYSNHKIEVKKSINKAILNSHIGRCKKLIEDTFDVYDVKIKELENFIESKCQSVLSNEGDTI